MTYPTRSQQFTTAPPAYIETDEIAQVAFVLATTRYGLPKVPSGIDAVKCLQKTAAPAQTYSGPSTSQTFFLANAQSSPSPVVVTSANGVTTYPSSVYTATSTQTVVSGVPGYNIVITWATTGTTGLPTAGSQITVPFTAVTDLPGFVMASSAPYLDVTGCTRTNVVDTQLTIRYRARLQPLLHQ